MLRAGVMAGKDQQVCDSTGSHAVPSVSDSAEGVELGAGR